MKFGKLLVSFTLVCNVLYAQQQAAGMQFCMQNTVCQIDGYTYPAVGYGTCLIRDKRCKIALDAAVQTGYRIVDTATLYDNFAPIGEVLNRYGRQNFYLISKVWHDQLTAEGINRDLKKTLERLKTTYLDAYLIHWPNSCVPVEETLWTMERLRQCGKIRHIGFSNVTANHLKRALEVGVPISWVQTEMHPFFCDFELLQFCQAHGIAVQAWCPLDRGGRVGGDPYLQELGQKYGKTPEQIALKWIIQHGCIPLPCSQNREHLKQNMDISNFTLTSEEMQKLDQRASMGTRRGATRQEYGFDDEFGYSYDQCWPKT